MPGVKGKSGGARIGSGRKSKDEELLVIERLTPLDDVAFESIKRGVEKGDFQFIKMFMEYRFGKPKEKHEVDHKGGINLIFKKADAGC
jgi:hypothetical protein